MYKKISEEEMEQFMKTIKMDINDKELQKLIDMINSVPCTSFNIEYMAIWDSEKKSN